MLQYIKGGSDFTTVKQLLAFCYFSSIYIVF